MRSVKLAGGLSQCGEKFSFGFFYGGDEVMVAVLVDVAGIFGVFEEGLFGDEHFGLEGGKVFGGHDSTIIQGFSAVPTGLRSNFFAHPPLKRRATVGRPCGALDLRSSGLVGGTGGWDGANRFRGDWLETLDGPNDTGRLLEAAGLLEAFGGAEMGHEMALVCSHDFFGEKVEVAEGPDELQALGERGFDEAQAGISRDLKHTAPKFFHPHLGQS